MTNETIQLFKDQDGKMLLFTGAWCPMCLIAFPKIMKIISTFDLGKDEVEIIEVEQGKQEPAKLIEKYNIYFVPTLIIELNGKEVGRIIENPKSSWANDVESILANQIKY